MLAFAANVQAKKKAQQRTLINDLVDYNSSGATPFRCPHCHEYKKAKNALTNHEKKCDII
jgi:hypothetical protein